MDPTMAFWQNSHPSKLPFLFFPWGPGGVATYLGVVIFQGHHLSFKGPGSQPTPPVTDVWLVGSDALMFNGFCFIRIPDALIHEAGDLCWDSYFQSKVMVHKVTSGLQVFFVDWKLPSIPMQFELNTHGHELKRKRPGILEWRAWSRD